MRRLSLATVLALAVLTVGTLPPSTASAREGTEWITAYWYNANDSKLPRVLLVGDSIVKGYQEAVRDKLAGTAYLAFYSTSKSVTDPSYLKELAYVLGEYDYAVILFNNGLHSLGDSPATWSAALGPVLDLLHEKAPHATILWVTSTPLKDADKTVKVQQLNAAAQEVMQSRGVPIVDLYARMDPLDRATHWADTYHFNAQAKAIQAQTVAEAVRGILGKPEASPAAAEASLRAAASETGPDGRIVTGGDNAAPVFRNAGFEEDGDWSLYSAAGDGIKEWNEESPHSGRRCLQVQVGTEGLQLYQPDPDFPPGTSQEISFWMKASVPAEVQVYIRTRRPPYRYLGTTTIPITEDWMRHSFKVTIPVDYTAEGNALFFVFTTAGTYDVDDITVEPSATR